MPIFLKQSQTLQVGDRVGYSAEFLRNTGQHTGSTPQARGRIVEFEDLAGLQLAVIDWEGAYGEICPDRVNVANLTRFSAR